MTVTMVRALVDELLRQGRARYPGAACGVLLGISGETPAVEASRPGRTVAGADGAATCAAPTDEDIREADRAGAGKGLAVVGTWHTHPDGPAEPARWDMAGIRAGRISLIVSVRRGQAAEWACWTPGPQGGPLEPVIVRMTNA
jgi:proteasome lid subunit RPN8/RPN11